MVGRWASKPSCVGAALGPFRTSLSSRRAPPSGGRGSERLAKSPGPEVAIAAVQLDAEGAAIRQSWAGRTTHRCPELSHTGRPESNPPARRGSPPIRRGPPATPAARAPGVPPDPRHARSSTVIRRPARSHTTSISTFARHSPPGPTRRRIDRRNRPPAVRRGLSPGHRRCPHPRALTPTSCPPM